MSISKFQASLGWILSCDHWPYSGGLFNIRVCLGSKKQGWKLFCSMLDKFVEKLDYARWFAENSLNIPPPILNRKLSYGEMAKSVLSNSPVPKPNFKVTNQPPSQKRKVQKSIHLPQTKALAD